MSRVVLTPSAVAASSRYRVYPGLESGELLVYSDDRFIGTVMDRPEWFEDGDDRCVALYLSGHREGAQCQNPAMTRLESLRWSGDEEPVPLELPLCEYHRRQLDKWARQVTGKSLREYREEYHRQQHAAAEQERQKYVAAVARQQQRRAAESVVYFVERGPYIKIGVTTQLTSRLASLARPGGCNMPPMVEPGPVRLLAAIPGDVRTETYFHRRFARFRISGTEWFNASPELWAFIHALVGEDPPPGAVDTPKEAADAAA